MAEIFKEYEDRINDFKRLIENGRLSHAYLFFGGNEGDREEKFVFASSLANFLEGGAFDFPAKSLTELLTLDKNEEGSVGIDEVRKLKYFLSQTSVNSKCRTVIIRDSESLTPEAQNAILKIVEEPPESSLIIFIATNEENLYPTLRSRLQRIHFPHRRQSSQRKIKSWQSFSLEDVIEKNEIDVFFESLIFDLSKEPIRNIFKLKSALRRLMLIKQFNVNKKLQLRVLNALTRR